MNGFQIFFAFVVVFLIVSILYILAKRRSVQTVSDELDTMGKILEDVKQFMVAQDSVEYGAYLSNDDFERAYHRRAKFHKALVDCAHGIEEAKIIIIDLIRERILRHVTPENMERLLGLDTVPPVYIQFEILLYRFKKKHGKQALSTLLTKYRLDDERPVRDQTVDGDAVSFPYDEDTHAYYITAQDIEAVYDLENITLSLTERAEVLAILVFQRYKGFGVIDTIREMDIDGLNCGTSGALLPQVKNTLPSVFHVESSVWVYFRGKQIHFRFLSFGSEDELRRIVLSLIRYGNKGSLTQNVGRVVATAPDKARITALCPPASESWAVFIRKFGFSGKSPEELLIKEYTKNGDVVVALLKYLMRGSVTCAFTGQQGSGKTTLMTSIIRYIDPRFTIRTLELAFEMYLRNLYPYPNILGVQETPSVSAATLQDTLKKTDAVVSIVGEVASDDVASRMIQMAQVASRFTLFSHHATTSQNLVMALRNSLVNAAGFSMDTAERQVVDVIKIDVHLDSTPDGKRYISRITEIIPLPPGISYPEYDGTPDSMNRVTKEYYERSTDRTAFSTRDILYYDLAAHAYHHAKWFSEDLSQHILQNLDEKGAEGFKTLALKKWGVTL